LNEIKAGDFSPTNYFLGACGLFSAGPPLLPVFVLGLGNFTIGFLGILILFDVMLTIQRFGFRAHFSG
jgi:hypothetical protein